MKADRYRRSGFYWVRFEGSILVAEYTADGLGCSPEGPHWHIPQSDACWRNREVCELLSGRILAPLPAAPATVSTTAIQHGPKTKASDLQ